VHRGGPGRWARSDENIQRYNTGIERSRSLGDNGTRDLLEQILLATEGHADWLESQVELVRQVGEAQYLAQQIRPGELPGGPRAGHGVVHEVTKD